ncbi:MAG: prepilin-type N-terminal cleavage/methylation domain-containing protein, partial [Verrucomicrobiae bacterium]|nr:prepilin-type N-terminal cleavage/methylation domain-containing protein [Verrucomicrobiae bacterium]
MRSRARCRGFSLAELLTVLGIIGVLVTLSVPALRGVSEGTGMMQALTRIGGTL